MSNPTIVCILGMQRSGTSAIARVLNLLGVYLGPEERLRPAGARNPKGFWEHRTIVALNDQLLARMGGTDLEPPDFPPHWQAAPELEDLRQAARALTDQDFSRAPLWGWKDPRTCLTLPFWQGILPPMRYVLCLRNPLDVASSLQSHDGFSLTRSLHLWFIYLRLSLLQTSGERRMVVLYEDLMSDWRRELARMAHFLDRPHLAESPDIHRALGDFLDTGLQHYRFQIPSMLDNDGLSPATRALHLSWQVYLALKQQPSSADGELIRRIDEGLNVLSPEILKERHARGLAWKRRIQAITEQLSALVPKGEKFIFVDEEQLGYSDPDRLVLPFLEKDGEYWGPPPDDDTAISELERLRRRGAHSIAFAWPAFWWLEHYSGLHRYLRANFRCEVRNDRLVLFALR